MIKFKALKKCLAGLLSAAMVMTSFTVPAMAEETPTTIKTVVGNVITWDCTKITASMCQSDLDSSHWSNVSKSNYYSSLAGDTMLYPTFLAGIGCNNKDSKADKLRIFYNYNCTKSLTRRLA